MVEISHSTKQIDDFKVSTKHFYGILQLNRKFVSKFK